MLGTKFIPHDAAGPRAQGGMFAGPKARGGGAAQARRHEAVGLRRPEGTRRHGVAAPEARGVVCAGPKARGVIWSCSPGGARRRVHSAGAGARGGVGPLSQRHEAVLVVRVSYNLLRSCTACARRSSPCRADDRVRCCLRHGKPGRSPSRCGNRGGRRRRNGGVRRHCRCGRCRGDSSEWAACAGCRRCRWTRPRRAGGWRFGLSGCADRRRWASCREWMLRCGAQANVGQMVPTMLDLRSTRERSSLELLLGRDEGSDVLIGGSLLLLFSALTFHLLNFVCASSDTIDYLQSLVEVDRICSGIGDRLDHSCPFGRVGGSPWGIFAKASSGEGRASSASGRGSPKQLTAKADTRSKIVAVSNIAF